MFRAIAALLLFVPGVIEGGLKVNQIPHECRMEAEFRMPVGIDRDALLAEIGAILARHEASWEIVSGRTASAC